MLPKQINASENHLSNRHPRILGAIFVFISLALAKWQIYDPLHAAAQGRKEVWVFDKLVILAIVLGVYGIMLLMFGKKANQWFKIDLQNISWKNAAFLIALAIFCVAIYIYVDRQLALQGYR